MLTKGLPMTPTFSACKMYAVRLCFTPFCKPVWLGLIINSLMLVASLGTTLSDVSL